MGYRRDRLDRGYCEQGQQERQARYLKGPGKAEGARSSCRRDGPRAHVSSKQAFKIRQATSAAESMAATSYTDVRCTAH